MKLLSRRSVTTGLAAAVPDRIDLADRLDELALRAAALTSAIDGLEVLNEDIRSGISQLAWEIRDELRELSDTVVPYVDAKSKEPTA